MAFLFAWSRIWSHFRDNLVFLPLVKILGGVQRLEICLQTTELSFDFSQVLKLCSCTAPQNEIQLLSRFFCSFSKLNRLLIGFLSRKVLQRDSSSSMALFVLVHAHSVDYRKTLLTFQIFFVFFHWFWVEESFAMGFNRSESLACRLLQQSTGKVSDLSHFQELHPRRA